MESGYSAMNALLSLPEPPTMVLCSNDNMAIGAMNACYARGVTIPDQISLIGFDDIVLAKYTNPALTTIHRPISDISKLGTHKLIELMNGPDDTVPKQLFVQTKLMIRQTVAMID